MCALCTLQSTRHDSDFTPLEGRERERRQKRGLNTVRIPVSVIDKPAMETQGTMDTPLLGMYKQDTNPSFDPAMQRQDEAPSKSMESLPLDVFRVHGDRGNRAVGEDRSSDLWTFEQVLSDLQAPSGNTFLRVSHALVFGTGLRCKGVYPVSLLLMSVVLIGAVSEAVCTYLR